MKNHCGRSAIPSNALEIDFKGKSAYSGCLIKYTRNLGGLAEIKIWK